MMECVYSEGKRKDNSIKLTKNGNFIYKHRLYGVIHLELIEVYIVNKMNAERSFIMHYTNNTEHEEVYTL